MNTNLIKSAIDAFKEFVAACGNDVCNENNENGEYVIFSGQVAADNQGNIKTYALVNTAEAEEPKKVLVAQVPLRPILNKIADFGKSLVDLYEADEAERKAEREAENEDLDNKINDLQSEITSLKLRKKSVR